MSCVDGADRAWKLRSRFQRELYASSSLPTHLSYQFRLSSDAGWEDVSYRVCFDEELLGGGRLGRDRVPAIVTPDAGKPYGANYPTSRLKGDTG
jgi:hypothetical protein